LSSTAILEGHDESMSQRLRSIPTNCSTTINPNISEAFFVYYIEGLLDVLNMCDILFQAQMLTRLFSQQ
jgi:hypothetical protein